jgi:hypothetical protein
MAVDLSMPILVVEDHNATAFKRCAAATRVPAFTIIAAGKAGGGGHPIKPFSAGICSCRRIARD